jgi:Glycolipid anchored surface protein (GAS1).
MRKVFRAVQWLLAISALVHVSTVDAISKISRSGRYLYSDDGNRFYIKGIAYQEQGTHVCFGTSNLSLRRTIQSFIGTVVASADNAFGEPSSFGDPLADGAACERDLLFLKQLTVNTIRVYSVNSSLNHDACMSALSGAGIYTMSVSLTFWRSPV